MSKPSRGMDLSKAAVELLKQAFARKQAELKRLAEDRGELKDKLTWRLTKEDLAELTGMSLSTVKRIFKGHADTQSIATLCAFLGVTLTDLRRANESEGSSTPEQTQPSLVQEAEQNPLLRHREQIHQFLLTQTKVLTTSPLLSNRRRGTDRKKLYIPLGLWKREELPEVSANPHLQERASLFAPNNAAPKDTLSPEQLLKHLIKEPQSPSIYGSRTAIVGETGAGKTTFLQWLAEAIFHADPRSLVIWVPLAGLTTSLEDYLREQWLKSALTVSQVDESMKTALEDLFRQKQVWLLLDGWDELSGSNSVPSLTNQLTSWVGQAHVVVSCRLNFWINTWNNLDQFNVYQMLDLRYKLSDPGEGYRSSNTDTLIEVFTNNWWFDRPDLRDKFLADLNKVANRHIKSLASNPLQLTLLCRSWEISKGQFPRTRTGLYEHFVEAISIWQQRRLNLELTQVRAINQALGKLALQAMDSKQSHFRLSSKLIEAVLDSEQKELALKLGWLNPVGVASEEATEIVYAFLHPSFQVYFASLAVPNQDFFLPRYHINKPVEDRNKPGKYDPYRVFCPHLHEVILFWLGRNDHHEKTDEKEEFMRSLVEFDDGCENLYDRSELYFLSKLGLQEFEACSLNAEARNSEEFTNRLEEEWDQHINFELEEIYRDNRDAYLKGLIKLLGFWMHAEIEKTDKETIFPPNFAYPLWSEFFLYTCRKEKVKELKDRYKQELEEIDTFDLPALVRSLSSTKFIIIRGSAIKNLIDKHITSEKALMDFINEARNYSSLSLARAVAWIVYITEFDQQKTLGTMVDLLNKYNDELIEIVVGKHLCSIASDQSISPEVLRFLIATSKSYLERTNRKNFVFSFCYRDIIVRCSSKMRYTEFYDIWHGTASAP